MKNDTNKNKEKKPEDAGDATPIKNKEEVQKNPDEHIDQDFPGYPHPPSREKTISPAPGDEEEKANTNPDQKSAGSANAFERSENDEVLRGELDRDDNDNEQEDDKNY